MTGALWLKVSQGPCRVCGKRWLLGWMPTNLMGVCSWRCARTLSGCGGGGA